MKRCLSMLLALALILSCGPAVQLTVQAQEYTALEPVYETHINPLYADVMDESALVQPEAAAVSGSEDYYTDTAEAAAYLLSQMKARVETINVHLMTADYDGEAAEEIFNQTMVHSGVPTEGDYLRWQYGGWGCQTSGYSDGVNWYLTLTYTITYYTTAQQEAQMDNTVSRLLEELNPDRSSDYNALKTVYDWMTSNIVYDNANLNDNSYKLKHTAYAALINRTSVCQGYAVLLYRLLLELGIDNRVIVGFGNGGGHAWNIVKLNGKYYNVDATWDASWTQAGLEYDFFLRSSANFGNHVRDSEYDTAAFNKAYPMSDRDYVPSSGEENDTPATSGACGENVNWNFDGATGVLTISGTGDMVDYEWGSRPWKGIQNSVTAIVIEEGVTGIGDWAFDNMPNVTDVTISSTVSRIGESALWFGATEETDSLENVHISDLAAWCAIVFEDTFANPLSAAANLYVNGEKVTELVIPSGVTAIADNAFFNFWGIKSAVIPESVTSIGARAFFACEPLTEVAIQGTLQNVGEYVFNMSGVAALTFAGSAPATQEARENLFNFYNSVVTVNYPADNDTWTAEVLNGDYIAELAFVPYGHEHSYTAAVTAPTCTEQGYSTYTCACGDSYVDDYVDAAGHSYAGGVCTVCGALAENIVAGGECGDNLTWVLDKDGVLTISGSGEMDSAKQYTWAEYRDDIRSVVIGDGITTVGRNAFEAYPNLAGVSFPVSLTCIESNAFRGCPALEEVYLPAGVSKLEAHPFTGCANLKAIRVDEDNQYFTSDESGVLYSRDMTRLYTAPGQLEGAYAIPASVTGISESAFEGCARLTAVTLPEGIPFVEAALFRNCTALETVNIPGGAEWISSLAFENCTSLKELTIPASVTSIDHPFAGCTGLTKVTFLGNVPSVATYIFEGLTLTVCYPAGNETWTAEAMALIGGKANVTWETDGGQGGEDVLMGDADGNSEIDNVDAMRILQYTVGLIDESQLNLDACDVSGDGEIDNVDAMQVLQYTVGLITEFSSAK